MSGTRLPSLKVQATEALIVSHGQPSEPAAGERYLSNLGWRVSRHLPGWTVRTATMAAPGKLEEALENAESLPLVFPLFMADGWFVRKALPKRLGSLKPCVLPPLGTLPELPALTAQCLSKRIAQQNWQVSETGVLIAAHGSATGPIPARCTHKFAEALKQSLSVREISVGFLVEEPNLQTIAAGMSSQTVLLPFFAGDGGHVLKDVPQALEAARFNGVHLPAVGQLDFVPQLIADKLKSAAQLQAAA